MQLHNKVSCYFLNFTKSILLLITLLRLSTQLPSCPHTTFALTTLTTIVCMLLRIILELVDTIHVTSVTTLHKVGMVLLLRSANNSKTYKWLWILVYRNLWSLPNILLAYIHLIFMIHIGWMVCYRCIVNRHRYVDITFYVIWFVYVLFLRDFGVVGEWLRNKSIS